MLAAPKASNTQARADSLIIDALDASLRLLNEFLPVQGWACMSGALGAQPLAVGTGVFGNPSVDALGALSGGNWQESKALAHLFTRTLNPAEHLRFFTGHLQEVQAGDCLLKFDLYNERQEITGCILGVAQQAVVDGATHEDWRRVRACARSIAFTLDLCIELVVANELVNEMQRDVFIDALTGVLNRAGWMRRLKQIEAQCMKSGADAAIVMFDLDFLKTVNDTHGHSAGDDLLRLTAQTISSALRSSDSVGRLGGDEFGVVTYSTTPAIAQLLIARLESALARVNVNVSLGMALKSEAGTLEAALELADERMYAYKRNKAVPRSVRRPLLTEPRAC
ncbi:GGDEF domain-containing protein [Parapusillimonas granuli]|uniref:diguanylate cyclase n=1 Tax=Parapusillimonas granuli TaxID=380911 RepID=A0A853FYP0_9BURK|nr:GGDEF domain-containing protein [Parapusillimonas granuli]MBB5216273.1 diguanylate cyclase (GGDEF)-like protein [Parapusillimonas granuli]MEB2400547.1 GGDEF domain-containing protein [Alcaligenaceae bacterium]NYT47950.1 GGDEF domain-containing protein [Parapusillimonas granuli]